MIGSPVWGSDHPHPGSRRDHRALYPSRADKEAPQTCQWPSSGAPRPLALHYTEAGTSLLPGHGLGQRGLACGEGQREMENVEAGKKQQKRAQPKLPCAFTLFAINQRVRSADSVYLGSPVGPGNPAALLPPVTHSLR